MTKASSVYRRRLAVWRKYLFWMNRPASAQTRCLAAFNSGLTQTDRSSLEAANTQRVADSLQPFTMAGCIQFLLQKYQDLAVDLPAPMFSQRNESVSTARVRRMMRAM